MATYYIETQAATRSKTRRTMLHAIIAATEDDAVYEARKRHVDKVGWNASVWISKVQDAPFTAERAS
jgi:hypothetical protein